MKRASRAKSLHKRRSSSTSSPRNPTSDWAQTFYSRLISWGREFNAIKAYIGKNNAEALGFGGAWLSFNSKGQAVIRVGLPEKCKATDPPPGTPYKEGVTPPA